jgi:hypothetical protein
MQEHNFFEKIKINIQNRNIIKFIKRTIIIFINHSVTFQIVEIIV